MTKIVKSKMADKEGRALVKKTAGARGRAMGKMGKPASTAAKRNFDKVMADSKKDRSKKMMGGGKVKGYKKGGTVSSASKRADGCATKGHTRGRMV